MKVNDKTDLPNWSIGIKFAVLSNIKYYNFRQIIVEKNLF